MLQVLINKVESIWAKLILTAVIVFVVWFLMYISWDMYNDYEKRMKFALWLVDKALFFIAWLFTAVFGFGAFLLIVRLWVGKEK